jgi:D-alanine-D-alanine ligase
MLDEFVRAEAQVIFPVLHGAWGEGGGLQKLLDQRGLPYVGSRAEAAALCMNKYLTKNRLIPEHIPTPAYEYLARGQHRSLDLPVVVKAVNEGSSIDLAICHNLGQWALARRRLGVRHDHLLVEKFIQGKEVTIGVISAGQGGQDIRPRLTLPCTQDTHAVALPAIHIIPATAYYDYKAKYTRQDTLYRFDIDLPASLLTRMGQLALMAHRVLDCRDLSRVDFIVDQQDRPWMLEVNTIPGFTSHSLLPMAARHAGLDLPALTDHLVRSAWARAGQDPS